MTLVTREFHLSMIRLLKGMIAVYEKWLRAQPVEGSQYPQQGDSSGE